MDYINTILVVDDADLVRTMLDFLFKKAGYNTILAADGSDALPFLDGRDIDLVITDLNMHVMHGDELIVKIRKNDRYKYVPIVLFMAEDATDRDRYKMQLGATTLFDKQGINENLLHTVKLLIG